VYPHIVGSREFVTREGTAREGEGLRKGRSDGVGAAVTTRGLGDGGVMVMCVLCCSVLQCIAVCCSVMQCDAV